MMIVTIRMIYDDDFDSPINIDGDLNDLDKMMMIWTHQDFVTNYWVFSG